MERNQIATTPIHTEDNRLARRLFQLEQRVEYLERQFEEMSEKLDFLLTLEAFRNFGNEEGGITFCTCDEDEEQ